MSDTITVVLPLPHKSLSANARVHWSALAKHRAKARQDAYHATLAAGGSKLWWPHAYATVRWYARTNRKQDETNLDHYLKAYYDGIADAGVVKNDRDIRVVGYAQLKDAADPRVEITLTRKG